MIGHHHRALVLEAQLKPCYRLQVSEEQLAETRRRYEARDLTFLVQSERAWFLGSESHVAYVSRDPDRARELADVERRQAEYRRARLIPRSPAGTDRQIGELLGIPSCCTDRFLAPRSQRFQIGGWIHRSETDRQLWTRLAESERLDYRLNIVFPRLRGLIEYIPCRFDCPASLAFAQSALDVLGADDSSFLARFGACYIAELEVAWPCEVRAYRRPQLENQWVQLAAPRRQPWRAVRRVTFG